MADLPKARDVGRRRSAKGYRESWRGYKLHIDAADGDIPVSRILAPASPRDSQAAIPLPRMTAERVDHRHGLMDAAHGSRETIEDPFIGKRLLRFPVVTLNQAGHIWNIALT